MTFGGGGALLRLVLLPPLLPRCSRGSGPGGLSWHTRGDATSKAHKKSDVKKVTTFLAAENFPRFFDRVFELHLLRNVQKCNERNQAKQLGEGGRRETNLKKNYEPRWTFFYLLYLLKKNYEPRFKNFKMLFIAFLNSPCYPGTKRPKKKLKPRGKCK
jgi:hypothetical protein